MKLLLMSQKELDRVKILERLKTGDLSPAAAALEMGVSRSQTYRLLARYNEGGALALTSSKRGKTSNRAIPKSYRAMVLQMVREHYIDFGPTLAAEKLLERHQVSVNPETLRLWMIGAGLWATRKQKRGKIYQPRHRRDCFGELIQIDGSDHEWFEDRAPRCTLLVYVDDATSIVVHLKFVESESALSYFRSTREYLQAYGKPVAFYADRHSVFHVSKTKTLSHRGLTQFGRALDELNIEMINANSSQAKGRVERMNKTLQDRLVKEMRLRNIASIAQGNAYLEEYRAKHNEKFGREPKNAKDLHRRIDDRTVLDAAFSWQVERKVSKSMTIQYNRMVFILDVKCSIAQSAVGERVTVHEFDDGRLDIRYGGDCIPYRIFDKERVVTQGAIVENKRLDAVLAHVRERQKERDSGQTRSDAPRRRDQVAGPFKARERMENKAKLHVPPVLPDGRDRSKCNVAFRTISKAMTIQHRYIRYQILGAELRERLVGETVVLCEYQDGEIELIWNSKVLTYSTSQVSAPKNRTDASSFTRGTFKP